MQRCVTVSSRSRRASARATRLACALIAVAALAHGCSADKPTSRVSTPGAGRAGSGGSAADAPLATNPMQSLLPSAAAGGAGGANSRGVTSLSAGSGPASAAVEACVQAAQEAQQVPVDMYIMLDRSDSMTEMTGAGPTKWDAMRDALGTFLRDSRSAGLGVGLQFFPVVKVGVPDSCNSDTECGPGGPCLNGICKPSSSGSFSLIPCATMADCPSDADGCTMTFGECSLATNTICFDVGLFGCGVQGACQRVQLTGFCGGADSCEAPEYAKPAVDIGSLPKNADALVNQLSAETTAGRTPTAAALSGALQYAKTYAASQPTHRVVAVLATDGLPTECMPVDAAGIGSLAKAALAGSPGIATYVVGVFGPDDTDARGNLNSWAAAGGTQTAFIVDPTQDVSAQFLDALDKIRSGSIACEYQIPPSPMGSDLDLDRVNVALIEGTKTSDFLYVADESRCGLAPLGWHYDADPATGGKPTKIVVCSSGCSTLKATDNARVEVRLGCKTKGPD
jgi:hypothetical protein